MSRLSAEEGGVRTRLLGWSVSGRGLPPSEAVPLEVSGPTLVEAEALRLLAGVSAEAIERWERVVGELRGGEGEEVHQGR